MSHREYGEVQFYAVHIIGNAPLNTGRKFLIFFSRREILGRPPLRPFRIIQLYKDFSVSKVGEGQAKWLPSKATSMLGSGAGLVSLCLQADDKR